MGFNDIISDNSNIVLVEWADKATEAFPSNAVWMEFENAGGYNRKIVIIENRKNCI